MSGFPPRTDIITNNGQPYMERTLHCNGLTAAGVVIGDTDNSMTMWKP